VCRIAKELLQNIVALVCILLGISPASNFGKPTFRNPVSVPSSRAGCSSSYFVPASVPPFLKCGLLLRGFTFEILRQFMVSLCVPHFIGLI
jgi:hypothetical protein